MAKERGRRWAVMVDEFLADEGGMEKPVENGGRRSS